MFLFKTFLNTMLKYKYYMVYQMTLYFIRWCSVVQLEGSSVNFEKNVVVDSRESLFLYKNEKDELGF